MHVCTIQQTSPAQFSLYVHSLIPQSIPAASQMDFGYWYILFKGSIGYHFMWMRGSTNGTGSFSRFGTRPRHAAFASTPHPFFRSCVRWFAVVRGLVHTSLQPSCWISIISSMHLYIVFWMIMLADFRQIPAWKSLVGKAAQTKLKNPGIEPSGQELPNAPRSGNRLEVTTTRLRLYIYIYTVHIFIYIYIYIFYLSKVCKKSHTHSNLLAKTRDKTEFKETLRQTCNHNRSYKTTVLEQKASKHASGKDNVRILLLGSFAQVPSFGICCLGNLGLGGWGNQWMDTGGTGEATLHFLVFKETD